MDAHAGEVAAEEPAGAELPVVVGLCVDPGLALHHDRPAGEPGPLAVDDADHDQQERPMEQQAPDLAERALLGGERRPPSVSRATRNIRRRSTRREPSITRRRSRGHDALLVQRNASISRACIGLLAERAYERAGPREQAGHERDEQERRDQHEPPGPEHVEEAGAAVERSDQRVIELEPHHPLRRVRPLRHERPDHRRQRQHQQQDQRRAHRAQGSPHQGRGPSQA